MGDGGILPQPTYRIGIPIPAIGHIDPQPVSVGQDDPSELGVDSEQHLEFVTVVIEPKAVDDFHSGPHQVWIVGGDADIGARGEEFLSGENKVGADRLEVLVRGRYLCRSGCLEQGAEGR